MKNPLTLAAFCAAISATTVAGCSERPTIQEVWAPDLKHKAVIYTVLAGATVPHNTCISVLGVDESPGRHPNAFWSQHAAPDSPEGPYLAPVVTVTWLTGDSLQVAYDPKSLVNLHVAEVDGVHIVYRPEPQHGIWPRDTAGMRTKESQ